jgi:hypothetical protein
MYNTKYDANNIESMRAFMRPVISALSLIFIFVSTPFASKRQVLFGAYYSYSVDRKDLYRTNEGVGANRKG